VALEGEEPLVAAGSLPESVGGGEQLTGGGERAPLVHPAQLHRHEARAVHRQAARGRHPGRQPHAARQVVRGAEYSQPAYIPAGKKQR